MLFDAALAVLGREKEASPALITRHILSEQRKFNLRILLAEDNSINQKLAVTVLQKAGYSVETVDNGSDAVAKAIANQYNAILMDVQMPGMDGFEATQRIRTWEKDHGIHIPIIAMTAHAMQGDRERCLAAGMDDYITKPLQPRVLFSALNRWIQNDSATVESQEPAQDYSVSDDTFSMDFDDGLFGEPPSDSHQSEIPASFQPSVIPADSLPVDIESTVERYEGDRVFVMEIIAEFQKNLPERIKEIHESQEAGQANVLSRLAHNLKGVSLNLGAGPLAQVALDLETVALHEDLVNANTLITQLDLEVVRLEEFYQDQISKERKL